MRYGRKHHILHLVGFVEVVFALRLKQLGGSPYFKTAALLTLG